MRIHEGSKASRRESLQRREEDGVGRGQRPRTPLSCALSSCTRSLRQRQMPSAHRCQSCAIRGMRLSPRAGLWSTALAVSSPCGRSTAAQAGGGRLRVRGHVLPGQSTGRLAGGHCSEKSWDVLRTTQSAEQDGRLLFVRERSRRPAAAAGR